ncbi:formin-like protein 16 [Iris pallida]|uniref:Formin-like protein 16 n=1 Tax=Iris pallida TaxID=29817 RepID=A0AAX6IKI4_IRIPA|nr:formin-like protein 16 [Iris pallida]
MAASPASAGGYQWSPPAFEEKGLRGECCSGSATAERDGDKICGGRPPDGDASALPIATAKFRGGEERIGRGCDLSKIGANRATPGCGSTGRAVPAGQF